MTIPLVLLGALAACLLAPLTLFGAIVLDRTRLGRRTRLVAVVTGGLVIEVGGILASLLAWIATGFGLFARRHWSWRLHAWIMGRYTAALMRLFTTVSGVEIEWRGTELVPPGPIVVIARHTSFFDAVIPATVLSRRHGLISHHVIASGLRYAPCIDLVGHRLPTKFLDRRLTGAGQDIDEITQLGALLDADSAAIIFPEGTFRDPQRFARAIERLRERGSDLAETASQLQHVLPPRPHGTLALLSGAPEADVIVCANTGLEHLSTLAEIRSSLSAKRPIIVETWRTPRADIPNEPEAFAAWLLNEYVRIDQWVIDRAAELADEG